MAPELAAVYVVGLPATAALTGLHAFLYKRKIQSAQMQTVQTNLRPLGMFWSDSESKVKAYSAEELARDHRSYSRTVMWLGIMCFGLSWIGFFLQLLVMFSIRYLAMPRAERRIFNSRIAREPMPSHETEKLLWELGLLTGYGTGGSSKS